MGCTKSIEYKYSFELEVREGNNVRVQSGQMLKQMGHTEMLTFLGFENYKLDHMVRFGNHTKISIRVPLRGKVSEGTQTDTLEN